MGCLQAGAGEITGQPDRVTDEAETEKSHYKNMTMQ